MESYAKCSYILASTVQIDLLGFQSKFPKKIRQMTFFRIENQFLILILCETEVKNNNFNFL